MDADDAPRLAAVLARSGRQGGGDDDVDAELAAAFEGEHPAVGIGPQRVGPDGDAVDPGEVEGAAEVADVADVPRDEVGAVEDHRGEGSGGVAVLRRRADACVGPDPNLRHHLRRIEAEAGHLQGVRQEVQELGHVGRAAGGEVAVHLVRRSGGNGRRGDELGVWVLLPAGSDEVDPAPDALVAQFVEGLSPGLPAAEEPNDDRVDAVERWQAVDAVWVEPADTADLVGQRVGDGAHREQLGVDVGAEQDHDAASTGRATAAAGRARWPERRAFIWTCSSRRWLVFAPRGVLAPRSTLASDLPAPSGPWSCTTVRWWEVCSLVTVAGQPRIRTGVPVRRSAR